MRWLWVCLACTLLPSLHGADVRGTVVDPAIANLEDVHVELYPVQGDRAEVHRSMTSRDGRFVITGLEAGDFVLKASTQWFRERVSLVHVPEISSVIRLPELVLDLPHCLEVRGNCDYFGESPFPDFEPKVIDVCQASEHPFEYERVMLVGFLVQEGDRRRLVPNCGYTVGIENLRFRPSIELDEQTATSRIVEDPTVSDLPKMLQAIAQRMRAKFPNRTDPVVAVSGYLISPDGTESLQCDADCAADIDIQGLSLIGFGEIYELK